MTNQTDSLGLAGKTPPLTLYIQFSDCGQHIRKFSHEPFDGGQEYGAIYRNWVCVVDGDDDMDETCVIDEGRYEDCLYAKLGMRREDCQFWQHAITGAA